MDSRLRAEPELHDDRRLDEAVFAAARLTRGGRPVAGIVIAAVVGGLALVGVIAGRDAGTMSAARVARPVLVASDDDSTREAPWRTHPGTGEPYGGPLLSFDAQVVGRRLFVNGDVFTLGADVVVVSVGDLDGRTVERRSLDLPGGSTAFRLGANDRFDVTFGLDDWTAELAWVTATVFDGSGSPLGTVRQSLAVSSGHDRIPGATAAPIVEYGWPPTRLVGDAFVPVRLEQPGAGARALTGSTVAVAGALRIHAASVRISLQTLDWVVLDATVLDTTNRDGGIRPLRAPAIDVALSLPTPRPTGDRLWVIVSAYDEAGGLLGAVRRLVTIGALAG